MREMFSISDKLSEYQLQRIIVFDDVRRDVNVEIDELKMPDKIQEMSPNEMRSHWNWVWWWWR